MAKNVHIDNAALWREINEAAAGPVEALAEEIASRVDVGDVAGAEVGVKMSTTRRGALVLPGGPLL